MDKETTSGANTGEQDNSAPATKKHFKPVGPDWVYNPRAPLNYRPRGPQQEFVVALIKELGTQQLALDRCVVLAMSSKSDEATEMLKLQMLVNHLDHNGIKVKWNGEHWTPQKFDIASKQKPDDLHKAQAKENERLKKLLKDMERDLSVSQAEIVKLKEKVPAVADAFIPVGTALEILKKIMTKKKHTSIEDSILYSIAYTSKNDWL